MGRGRRAVEGLPPSLDRLTVPRGVRAAIAQTPGSLRVASE